MNKDGYNINEFYVCIVNGCPKKSLSYAWLLSHFYRDHKEYIEETGRDNSNALQSRDIIR